MMILSLRKTFGYAGIFWALGHAIPIPQSAGFTVADTAVNSGGGLNFDIKEQNPLNGETTKLTTTETLIQPSTITTVGPGLVDGTTESLSEAQNIIENMPEYPNSEEASQMAAAIAAADTKASQDIYNTLLKQNEETEKWDPYSIDVEYEGSQGKLVGHINQIPQTKYKTYANAGDCVPFNLRWETNTPSQPVKLNLGPIFTDGVDASIYRDMDCKEQINNGQNFPGPSYQFSPGAPVPAFYKIFEKPPAVLAGTAPNEDGSVSDPMPVTVGPPPDGVTLVNGTSEALSTAAGLSSNTAVDLTTAQNGNTQLSGAVEVNAPTEITDVQPTQPAVNTQPAESPQTIEVTAGDIAGQQPGTVELVQPVQQVEAIQPVQQVETVQPVQPVEVVQSQPVQQVETIQPAEQLQVLEPVQAAAR